MSSGKQVPHRNMDAGEAERVLSEYLEEVSEPSEVRVGAPLPMGTHHRGNGVNFALFSRHATGVRLELYDSPEDRIPSRTVILDADRHRTGDVWHVWLQGIRPGQLYGYRVEGPYHPREGQRFNPKKLLLDPFATAVTSMKNRNFDPALGYDPASPQLDLSYSGVDDAGTMSKSVFTHEHFDWEGDRTLSHPWEKTVIYETHVRGLTVHPTSGVNCPGTYRGLVNKIPYLKRLGVTAVELMPVQEFNEKQPNHVDPLTGERLKDYWGYNPVAFLAPKASYCSCGSMGQQKLEFKEMVKALHRAEIEVILDVVFNHTAEGNQLGPTVCFRGIDNVIFYMLEADKRFYKDYTGTGNTFNANHPVVQDFILDALRYWVVEMHVDGFRFDLASVLGRDVSGNLLSNPPVLERIAEDPILRDVKVIAEAWDAAGAYQVGSFPGSRWAEWNGRYRDEVRRFWRGDDGMVGSFASRICGSSDIYEQSGKGPECSINFITCHDGFTLNDLVSYQQKHNEMNGEKNRDGMDENFSDNYGVEGGTEDPSVEVVRQRQVKNFLLTLFVSRGVPMLLGGDEFRRTQQGNNNAYGQDNEISWYNWSFQGRHRDIHRFTTGMIAFRRNHPVLSREAFYGDAEIQWFNPGGALPNWFDPKEKCLACLIRGEGEPDLSLMFNAGTQAVSFLVPDLREAGRWHVAVDTFRPSPQDLYEAGEEIPLDVDQRTYRVESRSSVILVQR